MSHDKSTLAELRIDRAARPQRQTPRLLLLALALLILLGGGIVWWMTLPKAVLVKTVTVREASSGGGRQTLLNASGYVTARRQATVSSKVTGKVIEVMVEEGMKVKEGQVLARLDSSNV